MPKNIIICADGTGNTTIKGRGTNVFKLYEAVDQNGHRFDPAAVQQVAIYHDGVGTETLKWARLFAGAFGWGLSRNVKQLYGELARVYDPGDHIFLFGYSRGAFTVRTLAGLVTSCGILDPTRYSTNRAFWGAVRHAYGQYRRKYQTKLSKILRGRKTVDDADLRREFSVAIPAFTDPARKIIDFIGVWETVDAVGVPFGIADLINGTIYRFKFPSTVLSPDVAFACHALALDEERQSFAPVLWREGPGDAERVQQVWFTGSHANVGGGYPRQGISLVALDWMMWKAEALGVRFLPSHRRLYRDATDVDDKLYEPRVGLGMFYQWQPRNVVRLCAENHVSPKVHRTVYQRIARNTEGYAPGSVPPDADVITTSSPEVTVPIRALVAAHHGDSRSLVEREGTAHVLGKSAYWLMIAMTLTCAAMIVATYYGDIASIPGWQERAVAVMSTIVSTNWFAVTGRTIWHDPWLAAGAVFGLWLNLRVASHLDTAYSEFWHRLRAPLRAALDQRRPV